MSTIKVGVIEDDVIIRKSLAQAIEMQGHLSLTLSAMSVEEGLGLMSDYSFAGLDVLLLDIGLPGISGLEGISPIRHKLPDVDIIILTTYDDVEKILTALQNGACSYISKKTSLKVILDSITTVYHGGSYMSPSIARSIANSFLPRPKNRQSELLTSRQVEIIESIAGGLSYKMIAAELDISIDTVRFHIKKIYRVLQVNSKMEAVAKYREGKDRTNQ